MVCLGWFYVLGPPVQYGHDVKDLVSTVMRETAKLGSECFTLENLRAPARYYSSLGAWWKGRGTASRDGSRGALDRPGVVAGPGLSNVVLSFRD